MFSKYFSKFLNYAVIVVLFFASIMSVIYILYMFKISNNIIPSVIIIVLYFLAIILYKKYGHKIKVLKNYCNKEYILFIIFIALTLRLLWVLLIPTKPASDFNLMYSYAAEVAKGDYYGFKGNGYFARFAHDTITVLYFSLFYHITDNPLPLIKILNVVYQTVSVFLMYLVTKEIMGKKSALISAALLAVFPACIMYTSETMSENMALPFYILSVYLLIKSMKENSKTIYLLLCGFSLSVANMFRMVGVIFLIAFILYFLIYKGSKECLKRLFLVIASYVLLSFLVSQSLIYTKITENHLWNPKEPVITSILRGTNIEHFGRWNKEDAKLPSNLNYDPLKIKKVSKEIIIERLTKTPAYRIGFHYIAKLSMQWGLGDFGAYGWSVEESGNTVISNFMKGAKSEINIICSLIYITLLIRIIFTLLKREYEDFEEMNLLFIIFGGFVFLYLITEAQERYGFIAAWLIIVFGSKAKESYNIAINKGYSLNN